MERSGINPYFNTKEKYALGLFRVDMRKLARRRATLRGLVLNAELKAKPQKSYGTRK